MCHLHDIEHVLWIMRGYISASDELLRELIIIPTDLAYLFTTSNETVHQNGNAEQIAPVAVSGATAC